MSNGFLNFMDYQNDIFGKLDSDATVKLQRQNEAYRTLDQKLSAMKKAHPFLYSLEKDTGEMYLTREEHEILRQCINLIREMDTMERENLYLLSSS